MVFTNPEAQPETHKNVRQALNRMADFLDDAPREGAAIDEPEGARYITISETYLKEYTQSLRDIAIACGGEP